jgi:hypothetical protein
LSCKVDECKPLPTALACEETETSAMHTVPKIKQKRRPKARGVTARRYGRKLGVQPSRQGLTRVHFSAQRKHILWDTLGA